MNTSDSLGVAILDKSHVQMPLSLAPLKFVPSNFSFASVGGPERAEIDVFSSSPDALYQLFNVLRNPVEIFSATQLPLWWGFIESVRVQTGSIETEVSLAEMANRICALYSTSLGGTLSSRATTAWASSTESVNTYGTKELRISISEGSQDQAERSRDSELALRKYPISVGSISSTGTVSATITCKGWWDTLKWKYYSQNSGVEQFDVTGVGVQEVGKTSGDERVRQGITISSSVAWVANEIQLKVRKQGAPTDNLRVELQNSSGTMLAYCEVTGPSMLGTYEYVPFVLSTPITVTPTTQYIIQVSRTSSVDSNNHYMTDINTEEVYTGGVFQLWNGSSWVARSPDGDMVFRLVGARETTLQVSDIITSCGQFFPTVKILTPSGVYSNPWRDGDNSGLSEITELLRAGAAGGPRYLATVLKDRTLVVYLEPTDVDYLIDSSGNLYTPEGKTPIPRTTNIAGKWLRRLDIPNVNISRISDPRLMFIEKYEWQSRGRNPRLEPRGALDVWNPNGIREG